MEPINGILPIKKIDVSGYLLRQKPFRSQVIDEILANVNRERTGRYKPLTARFVAIKVNSCCKHDMDLDYLIKRCREHGYTKILFGATKQKSA